MAVARRDFLDAQTGVIPNDHRREKTTVYISDQLDIRHLPTRRALVLEKASRGNFMLVDLRGRVIFRMKLSDQPTDSDVAISLPEALGTGLYLARFEGVDGIRQTKITIAR